MNAAFDPESVTSGSILPVSDQQLFSAIDTLIAGTAPVVRGRDGWLADGVPLLSRGDAWILPLYWHPQDSTLSKEQRRHLRDRSSELWNGIRGWNWNHHGDQIGIDLQPESDSELPTRYANELVRTGARRADWWGSGGRILVRVDYGDPIPAPIAAMALHFVPNHWAWYDRRQPGNL